MKAIVKMEIVKDELWLFYEDGNCEVKRIDLAKGERGA